MPDVSQTLILTRRATRTSMPPNEQLVELARHGTTMALFLSVRRPRELQAELIEGGYAPATPCAVVYRATLAGRGRPALPAERARADHPRGEDHHPGAGDRRPRAGRRRRPRGARTSTTPATATATARWAGPTATARRRGMEQPELREPNLPASARRVATGKLRHGWTTGTCATAAAKAACLLLRDGDPPAEVEVPLPKGRPAPVVRARALRARRRRGRRGRGQGRGRRPRRDPRRRTSPRASTLRERARDRPARRRRRRDRHPPGPRPRRRRSGHQRRAAPQIAAAVARGRSTPTRSAWSSRSSVPGRREDGPSHLQPAPGHRRRHLDPRHHRDRAPVLHRGVARERRAGDRRHGRAGRRGRSC